MSFMSDLMTCVRTICNTDRVGVHNDTTVVVVSKFWGDYDFSTREEWLRRQLTTPRMYSPYYDVENKRFICLTPDELEYSEIGNTYKNLFT